MSGGVDGCSAYYEDLSKASSLFTRASEDLGANCVFDISQCRADAEQLFKGLQDACAAIEVICGADIPLEAKTALKDAAAVLAEFP